MEPSRLTLFSPQTNGKELRRKWDKSKWKTIFLSFNQSKKKSSWLGTTPRLLSGGKKKGESEINLVYFLWKMLVWTDPAGEGVLWG